MSIHNAWQPLFDQYEIDLDSIYNDSVLPVYPLRHDVFRVFSMDPSEIRLVLLGQDPYHGPGQAHGLAFSVAPGVPVPPSLQNIFKELQLEFPERNYKFPHGNLQRWHEEEKIFLLNTALTVLQGQPNSHSDLWTSFTDDVIRTIVSANINVVWLLLGNYAKSKASLISDSKRIITGVHPSPLSAHRGFFNSGIFRTVEERLGSQIDWSI
jgi:uracil-DNA glycosylase